MAGSFVFMEWLNHAVVHGDRFLARPEYGEALIKGVPNTTLLYVCATFFALAVLWALPFPRHDSSGTQDSGRMGKAARVAIFGAPPNTQSRPPAMCTTPPIGNRCQGRTAIGSASRPTTLTATWSAGVGVQRRSAHGYPAIVRGHCVDCASAAPLETNASEKLGLPLRASWPQAAAAACGAFRA
jgi:hypothetical protein